MNLTNIIIDILGRNPEKVFTSRNLAEIVFNDFSDFINRKKENTIQDSVKNTKEGLITQISAEISSKKESLQKSNLVQIDTSQRPILYKFINNNINNSIYKTKNTEENKINTSLQISEEEFYPIVIKALEEVSYYNCSRIDDKKTRGNNSTANNKWLHPDILAMLSTFVCSFEVKLEINKNNIREYFAQTLLNSYWANYGYLVGFILKEEDKEAIENELDLLNKTFCEQNKGIGLIIINNSSKITYRKDSKIPKELNKEYAKRIFKENNSDFNDFIERNNLVIKIYNQ